MQIQNTKGWLGGLALILAGLLFLAQNLNLIGPLSPQLWMYVFAGASLLFFATYFLSGIQEWGWLFPACILGAVAGVLGFVQAGREGPFLGSLVLVSIAIPFLAAYLLNRAEHWWALIPAWVMLALAGVAFLAEAVPGEWIGGFVMWAIALPFLVVYLRNHAHWWALIPAFVLAAIGSVIPLSTVVESEWIGSFIMLAIALPFLVVYLRNHAHWWALIPACVLAGVAVLIPLAENTRGEWAGAFMMFAIALPFGVVYFWSERNWWAVIPAGLLASVGLLIAVAGALPEWSAARTGWMRGLLFLGCAVTFAVVWLRPRLHPQPWARYPAAGFALAALAAPLVGDNFDLVWPVLLIAGGVLALWSTFRPGRGSSGPSVHP